MMFEVANLKKIIYYGYSVRKPESPDVLACLGENGLLTRPSMRVKRGESAARTRIEERIVGVRSTEQSL